MKKEELTQNAIPDSDSGLKQASVQAGPEETKMLTFESMDDEVCPAECVTEIFTPQEFKQQCLVRIVKHFGALLSAIALVCVCSAGVGLRIYGAGQTLMLVLLLLLILYTSVLIT
jgi:hypothetical protein